jgi:hypothetical protein
LADFLSNSPNPNQVFPLCLPGHILNYYYEERQNSDKQPLIHRAIFHLFHLQAPSCERPKTNQRTLFLSFAINNCYPTSDEKLLAVFESSLGNFLPL